MAASVSGDHEAAAPGSTGPVFLVGMARSGTTLLRTTIGLHPRIHMSDEAHFVGVVDRTLHRDSPEADHDRFDTAWRLAEVKNIARRFPRVHREDVEAVLGSGRLTAARFLEAVLTVDARPSGKVRWGGKVPLYLRPVDKLLRWFPEARVVWLVRDPRATVASARKKRWGKGRTARELASGWSSMNYTYARRFFTNERVHFVRYEDLVADWESSVRQLFRFLGEEPDERVLQPAVNDVRLNSSFEKGTERSTAIAADRNESWRRAFTTQDVWEIENATAAGMQHYNYHPVALGRGYLSDGRRRLVAAWHDARRRLVRLRSSGGGRRTSRSRSASGTR